MYTRILKEKDVSLYRQLRLKSYQTDPLSFSESYEDEVNKTDDDFITELQTIGDPPEWFVLGMFTELEELIGFVKFRRDMRSKARHKAMIHAMYIDPEFRNKGWGEKLMTALLEKAEKMEGLQQVHLWVLHAAGAASAASFYKDCGFESQGTRVKNDLKINDQYVDAEYMVMYLNIKKIIV